MPKEKSQETAEVAVVEKPKTIHEALIAAQSEIRAAGKSGSNTYDKYTYAMLQDYCNAIHEPMQKYGLGLSVDVAEIIDMADRTTSQGKVEHAVRVKLRGILVHTSGQTIEYTSYGEGQDRADKALYKAITGGKKYLIANIFNVPTTDDPETDSHEGFDEKNKPRQAPEAKAPTKAPPKANTPAGGQRKPQSGQNTPPVINDVEQQERGCINSTLVSELRGAVLVADKANKLDPVSQFLPWLEQYLDALYAAKGMEQYKRKYKGTSQVLCDIPATAYKEILEAVKTSPESCRVGYDDAAAQDDSGVA